MPWVRKMRTCRLLWCCPIIEGLLPMVPKLGSAFLPTHTQGTTIFPQRANPIEDLHPQSDFVTDKSHGDGIDLINRINRMHRKSVLLTRGSIPASAVMNWRPDYNCRPRMHSIFKEPKHIMKMYGLENPKKEYPKEINPKRRPNTLVGNV